MSHKKDSGLLWEEIANTMSIVVSINLKKNLVGAKMQEKNYSGKNSKEVRQKCFKHENSKKLFFQKLWSKPKEKFDKNGIQLKISSGNPSIFVFFQKKKNGFIEGSESAVEKTLSCFFTGEKFVKIR